MPRLISADVIDDSTDDWAISDEGKGSGAQRGPITTWPAPILRHDDRNPLLPFTSMNRRKGQLDAYDFLREKVTSRNLFGETRGSETESRGFESYAQNIDASGCCDAGMLLNPSDFRTFIARTDAGALDDAGMATSWYEDFSKGENQIIAFLKQAGAAKGGKFGPTTEKAIRDGFVGIRSHATDSSKWNPFNQTKTATFKMLQSLTAGPAYQWNKPADANQKALQAIWNALEAHMNDQGGTFSFVSDAIGSVGGAIGSVGKGVVSIAKGVATPVAGLITSPIKLASDIAQGKNVLASVKDTVTRDIKNIKGVAPYVQAVISFVPGIGAGVNAAIAAGAALANGQPITSALVAGLKNALPGGPIAAQAFETAYQVARGANVGEAALAAARAQIPGGDIGKAAFDAGLAIAKGQNIQQAAVGLVKGAAVNLVPGNNAIVKNAVSDLASGTSVVDTALKAGTSAMATFSPTSTGPFSSLGPRIKDTLTTQNLTKLLPGNVSTVANAVLNNASLRGLSVNELAAKLNVPNHIAREGMASVLQSVIRSGGAAVPHLAPAQELAAKIPMTATFDQGMANFASKMSPIAFSHNARRPMQIGTRAAAMNLAQMKNPHIVPVYAQQNRAVSLARANSINPWRRPTLGAQGWVDAGAIDPAGLPVLRQGSTGAFVSQWQNILKTTADGKFGPQTTSLTKQFQALKGLTADGVVGPNTWKAGLLSIAAPTTSTPTLPPISIPVSVPGIPSSVSTPIVNAMPTIRQGSTGTAVKTWQAIVGVPVDGQFGPQTATATRAWQTKNGLTADGVVGPNTWTKALAGTATTIPIPPPPTTPGIPTSLPPISIPVPGGGPPIVVQPPSLPPWNEVPGAPPIFQPPTSVPTAPPVITTTTPIPGGPIITTSTPTGGGPIVVSQPPILEPPTKAGMGPGVAIAVGLGLLLFVAKGSSGKLL